MLETRICTTTEVLEKSKKKSPEHSFSSVNPVKIPTQRVGEWVDWWSEVGGRGSFPPFVFGVLLSSKLLGMSIGC